MIIMMSASQFITQRQLMTKNMDLTVKTPFMQQQKMLMYVFPVMFAVMGINFPVGVLVYWLTTNVWSMGQQLIVIRNNPTPGSQAFAERQARLKKQGRINPDGSIKKVGLMAMLSGGSKGSTSGDSASAGETVEGAVQVRRQQPRKQTKAQRQQTGHVPSLTKEPQDAEPETTPADEVPAEPTGAGAGKPAAKAGQRQQPKRGGQQSGQGRKKKS
jgi:YidC/Oxa1 family membrane protein insertase